MKSQSVSFFHLVTSAVVDCGGFHLHRVHHAAVHLHRRHPAGHHLRGHQEVLLKNGATAQAAGG